VIAYDSPHRFAYEEDEFEGWEETHLVDESGAQPIATERRPSARG
jgi:hypothetical protein